MPSAHCDSNGSSGSGLQTSDFEGVHDFDDVGSLWEHKIDCGQPIHTSIIYVDAFSIYHKNTDKAQTPLFNFNSIENQIWLTKHFSI